MMRRPYQLAIAIVAVLGAAAGRAQAAQPIDPPVEQRDPLSFDTTLIYADDERLYADPARIIEDPSYIALGYVQPFNFSYRAPDWTPEFAQFGSTFDQPLGSVSLNVAASTNPLLHPLTRLDTAISRDLNNHKLHLRLGDSINDSGGWDHAVRFGGLQFGSMQSSLAADAIASPELSTAGRAVIPSTADLLSNRSTVLPHASGNGQVSMAVSDLLGRSHEITRPLFADAPLMGKGQLGYSVSVGRVRENYLIEDNNYGAQLTSGSLRYGVSSKTTVDFHAAQVAGDVSVVGGSIEQRTGPKSLVSAAYAGSRTATDQGWFARAGYQYQDGLLMFAVRSRVQSPTYRDIGTTDPVPIQRRTLASAAVKMGPYGDFAVAGVSQTYVDQTSMDYLSVSHSVSLNQLGFLTTSLAYAPVNDSASGILISFAHPFGRRGTAADTNFTRTDILTYSPLATPAPQAKPKR
jgi:outer membrane usher protein